MLSTSLGADTIGSHSWDFVKLQKSFRYLQKLGRIYLIIMTYLLLFVRVHDRQFGKERHKLRYNK